MKRIGAVEAKNHLFELLDLVTAGERVTITRGGKPVATLVPLYDQSALTPADAAAQLRDLRRGVNLGSIGRQELIVEGRR